MNHPTRLDYSALDAPMLSRLLTDPQQGHEVHRAAFEAIKRINPDERRARLVGAARAIIAHPGSYDEDLLLNIIEIFATDPDPYATSAMLELLPDVLQAGMGESKVLSSEVREYFCEALVTRGREDDLAVWARELPRQNAQTLVAAMLDPAARSLEVLEPLTLIGRLDEPQRSKALVTVITGLARQADAAPRIREAAGLLRQTSSPMQLAHSVDVLADRWRKARRSGSQRTAHNLEIALSIVDDEPRSTADRLTGQRPWAS